jgi:hypothetical protein
MGHQKILDIGPEFPDPAFLLRIRIQILGSDDQKFIIFLDQNLQFTNPWASIKDVQATGRSLRPSRENF